MSEEGKIDGLPCLCLWDAYTLKMVNQIAINDQRLISVEFSSRSNMLLVVSQSDAGSSCVSVWDFLDGHKDILCRSHLPSEVTDARWNYFLGDSNEFVTVSGRKYHFWKITPNLTLQYMEGDIPKANNPFTDKEERFTTCEFLVPTSEQLSVYLLLGTSHGYAWVVDSRCNQFMYSVKVLDTGAVKQVFSSTNRIVIEGASDPVVHCWP